MKLLFFFITVSLILNEFEGAVVLLARYENFFQPLFQEGECGEKIFSGLRFYIALHLLFGVGKPLAGNATLEKTVDDFTAAAKAVGAQKVRIVQSSKTALWFIFPPVSFFITPVISNVAGDAL